MSGKRINTDPKTNNYKITEIILPSLLPSYLHSDSASVERIQYLVSCLQDIQQPAGCVPAFLQKMDGNTGLLFKKEFLGIIFILCSVHLCHAQSLPNGFAPGGAWDISGEIHLKNRVYNLGPYLFHVPLKFPYGAW